MELYLRNKQLVLEFGKYRHWIFTCMLSFIVSATVLCVYHFFLAKEGDYFDKMVSDAKAVAEKEISLSGRYASRLRTAETTDLMYAASSAAKAVVAIRVAVDPANPEEDASPQHGSGVVISSDGLIMTNYHVIQNANKIEITLSDNRQFAAEVKGYDVYTDLALLKVEAASLPFLLFGNSDSLTVGEWVLAVGNPFRLQSTATAGIISAKARQIQLLDREGIESFIQTDAAINPGNSGGALVNTAGELVGISTAVMSESGRYEGFSFAIPSNIVQKVAADITRYGSVQRGWLGVECVSVDQEIARESGLPFVSGVRIQTVQKEGAGANAGLLEGDIITAVDQLEIQSYPQFIALLATKRPGDQLNIQFFRNKKRDSRTAILKNQSNTHERLAVLNTGILQKLGLEIRDATSREKTLISGAGAVILSVKKMSQASLVHLQPGYVVIRCNKLPVYSARQLTDAFEENIGQTIRLEGYYPGFPGKYPYEFVIAGEK
jgi:serine protease Do